MKLLLDTHTLLWSIGKTNELSKKVIQEIKNADNDIYVSAVSLWEIALKSSIGKLFVSFHLNKIPEYCRKMRFTLIPLEPLDSLTSMNLPQKDSHKDPFDRMLIFQCIQNEYVLVSKDKQMELYEDEGLVYLW
jgi:PIN domain nuclease of toxin-antitoxin system